MKVSKLIFNSENGFIHHKQTNNFDDKKCQLVLAFGDRILLENSAPYQQIKEKFPNASIVISSSAGQIIQRKIELDAIAIIAIEFEKSSIKTIEHNVFTDLTLQDFGNRIENELLHDDLKALLILSEGSLTNGTELINEFIHRTQKRIPIFGGLAGDDIRFEKTIVGLNKDAAPGNIVVVGFYGNNLSFGFGSSGGWSDFGPEREVTLSNKNTVYKIGNRFALDLYKEYLGKYADELPGSSLYFPLSMKEDELSEPVVRTILSIDEEQKSMTFAGDIPQGSRVRLMKGNHDKLVDASYEAANQAFNKKYSSPQIVFLVSCVGRRIVLGNRIEEELEVVREVYGDDSYIFGFYSYGEISPSFEKVACELHNQTMTITTLFETI